MSQEDRQAIGRNNEAARRAIGQRMVDDRKAIAAGISASRASTFKRDLNALESSPRRTVQLSQREARGTRAPTVGRGNYVAPPSSGTGGGIASPLTETDYATREFHPSLYLKSADGIFVWEIKPPAKIVMTDANDAQVDQIFAVPT